MVAAGVIGTKVIEQLAVLLQPTIQQAANANNNVSSDQQSIVSEISERGSQNGRGFGRGAYNA